MGLWGAIYPNSLLVSLTDTFSIEVFYKVCGNTLRSPPMDILTTLCPFNQDFVVNPVRAKHWTAKIPAIHSYTPPAPKKSTRTSTSTIAPVVEKVLKLKKKRDKYVLQYIFAFSRPHSFRLSTLWRVSRIVRSNHLVDKRFILHFKRT